MTTSAGVVVGWAHQSGHGHDATAVSGAAPTLATAVVSGHDGIRFASAGTIAMTFTSSLPWDGALVLSFAFRHRTPPMQTGLLFGGALMAPYVEVGVNRGGSFDPATNFFAFGVSPATSAQVEAAANGDGQPHVVTVRFDGSALSLRVDGTDRGTQPLTVPVGEVMTIGSARSYPAADADMLEIMATRDTSSAAIDAIETYLRGRYGI